MYSVPLTFMFIAQIYCEWVEISQQHYNYKKPIRPTPTHTHPLLASTTLKRDELERSTPRNRVYINHTVRDYNWNTGSNQLFKDDYFINSAVNFKDRDDFANKRPPSDNKDVLIIRRRKPENTRHKEKTERPKDFPNSEYDNEMKKTADDKLENRQPLDDYKGAIEVLNLSELEYTTTDDVTNIKVSDNGYNKKKLKRKDDVLVNTVPPDDSRRSDSQFKTTELIERNKQRPETEHTSIPPLLKTTNMRRVNIIRSTSTYRTPTQQFEDEDYQSNTPIVPSKSTETIEVKAKERPPTTPYRFPHIGYVKRVNITNTMRTTPKPSKKNNKPTINVSENENILTENKKNDENNKAIRKVDKLLQTSSERTRTTPTEIKTHKTRYDNKNIHKILTPEDIMVEEILNEDEGKKDFKVHKVSSIGNIQKARNPTIAESGKQKNYFVNNSTVTPTSKLETIRDSLVITEKSSSPFNKVYKVSNFPNIGETPILTAVNYKKNMATERPDEVDQIEKYQPNPYKPISPSGEPIPEFVTKEENFINGDFKDNLEISTENVFKLKPTEPSHEETTSPGIHLTGKDKEHKSQEQINKNKEQKYEDPISDKTKPSAIENLIKFLKTVTDIISKNSRRGVLGKVRYLEDLRDTILANIEERLEAAFPDDDVDKSTARGRRARSAPSASPRGHVEFPSSESALMTISFLTFAVFLIKLILQVIQAYKNKTMMVMPTVISAAVGRAITQRQRHSGN